MTGFTRGCGGAFFLGGALTFMINVIATPLLPRSEASAVVMSTNIFLLRQSASGVAALLLLFGCVGLHVVQSQAAGAFGAAAFVVSFVGASLLLAVEWANVFVLRAVARTNPEVLSALDKNALLNIGAACAAGLFHSVGSCSPSAREGREWSLPGPRSRPWRAARRPCPGSLGRRRGHRWQRHLRHRFDGPGPRPEWELSQRVCPRHSR